MVCADCRRCLQGETTQPCGERVSRRGQVLGRCAVLSPPKKCSKAVVPDSEKQVRIWREGRKH